MTSEIRAIAERLDEMADLALDDEGSQAGAKELREIAEALRQAKVQWHVDAPAVFGFVFALGVMLGAIFAMLVRR